MDDMVLDILNSRDQVSDDSRIVRDDDLQCIFDRSHGAGGVNRGSYSSDPGHQKPDVPRVPVLCNDLKTPEHGAG